jgi:hypothetical protein
MHRDIDRRNRMALRSRFVSKSHPGGYAIWKRLGFANESHLKKSNSVRLASTGRQAPQTHHQLRLALSSDGLAVRCALCVMNCALQIAGSMQLCSALCGC